MIKNLIYGALGAGAVAAAATALVMASASSEPPTSCTVTLDANGGEFTTLETNVYVRTVSYSNTFGTVFNDETTVTNYNYRLTAWTNATGVVSNDTPVLSDVTCYAQWERLPIQRFDLVNGEFNGTDEEGANHVAQFPAAFYGTATITETNGHVICFTSPTSGTFRVSFDPQIGWDRTYAKMSIVHNNVTNNFAFGESGSVPVNFLEQKYEFQQNESYRILLDFSAGWSKWGNIQSRYVLGIGLSGHQVKFDPGEYGSTSSSFCDPGANLTTNLPYGYLPGVSTVNSSVSFLGWFSAKKGGVQLTKTMLVETNEIYYAHYKLPTYNYYVTFAKSGFDNQIGMVQGYQMPKQTFTSGVAQSLSNNRYYLYQHKFVGWATEPNSTTVTYPDGQSVTDIWDIPEGTCPLYAVWKETPGENHFTVSKVITNFTDVAVSTNVTTFVAVPGSIPNFSMTVTNMTPATLRVSLDPAAGSKRSGAKLCIDRLYAGTWSNSVCTVSDLSTNAVYYTFAAAEYRFRVTGGNTAYSYSVGIGAKGARIDFDPSCKGYVNASTLSSSLTFDWTTDSPFGYLPSLTSSKYGTHLGWFYSKDVADTNAVTEADVVASNATLYAHWANQPYYIAFQGNGATSPTSAYVQEFCYGKAQALSRNQYYKIGNRFEGWATNAHGAVVYADCQIVSNLCAIAGATNTLYAVWQETPSNNWYYVAEGATNFTDIAISEDTPTRFAGRGDVTQFQFSTPVKSATAKCRISLDPQDGYPRVKASLAVEEAEIPTNTTETLEWETVCTVTDLSEKSVACTFTSNRVYRFTIAGLESVKTNGYVVGIGVEGAQYTFEPCSGTVSPSALTQSLTFNWSVGTQLGYLPLLTNSNAKATGYTWDYSPVFNATNAVCTTNIVVSGSTTAYAHWEGIEVFPFYFDYNLDTYGEPTNTVVTNFYSQGTKNFSFPAAEYQNWGFLGWTTNFTAGTTSTWHWVKSTFAVSNSVHFSAQWNKLWRSTSSGSGVSILGYNDTYPAAFKVPDEIGPSIDITILPETTVDVVAIGDSAFTNATFTTLSLPETLTSIGDSAFMGCAKLTALEIPATVTYVGDSAFEDCTSLRAVTFPTIEVTEEYATGGYLAKIVGESDDDPIEMGEATFRGCTALRDVSLPLGLMIIPNEFFSGCSAMTEFSLPHTVTEIGEQAFAECTHLQTVVVGDIVDAIDSLAFYKCARMKIVRFIGDQPQDVESDIFQGTPRNTLVSYLQNMRTTDAAYCGGSWPDLPGTWPSESGSTNSYGRTLTWIGDGQYPRFKVNFNMNDGDSQATSTVTPILYHSGRDFGLLAPQEEDLNKDNFSGWWTQPIGGRKIGNYLKVTEGMTVYAHWNGDEEESGAELGSRTADQYPVEFTPAENPSEEDAFTGFYTADDDMFYYAASTFNGIVIDTSANNALTGTVVFTFSEGRAASDGGQQSSFTSVITWAGGKTTTISGVANAEGYLVANGSRWSYDETAITKSGIYGTLTDNSEGATFTVYAARNRYAMSTTTARSIVLTALQASRGTWHVVLKATGEGEGAELANGYSTFAIAIAGMGEATIEGTMADGSKVSATSTLIIGDGCACLPVMLKPNGGKGAFSFLLWFAWGADGSIGDETMVTGWTTWVAPTFTATIDEAQPLTFIDDKRYSGEATFEAESEATATLLMSNTVWKVSDRGESNVHVTYDAATGIFKGSFSAETSEGQTTTASVSGVFTDRITTEDDEVTEVYHGYGTAVIKGERSIPVEITTLDD